MNPAANKWSHRLVICGSLLIVAVLAAACGGDDTGDSASPDTTSTVVDNMAAQVASYELVADRDQRFIIGLFSNEDGMVSYGTVDLAFSFLGTADNQLDEPKPGPEATATFLPIPGSGTTDEEPRPRFTSTSEARGVYGVESIRFDEPGFWEVTVDIEIEGTVEQLTAAFEVGDESHVPVAGDPAPRTENLLPGDPDAPPTAIDSRAEDDGSVPDPELHSETVASAIEAGRPLMVVVSTPVYCVSRFCGPITDTVQQLAADHGEDMAFVHIEVYRDYEANTVNKAATEWIWPDRVGEPAEPWVFLVDANGTVVERWDNVATEKGLTEAVQNVLEGAP